MATRSKPPLTDLATSTGAPPTLVADAPWTDELEALHEEGSRTHFIDVWTRRAMLRMLRHSAQAPVVADLGCSTGYLLEDVHQAVVGVRPIGLDTVFAGLRKARANLPDTGLLQGDCCFLPFGDATVDAVVSANMLEHVPDDEAALVEIRRVLRPGGRAVLVVPAGPRLYDYYDRFLHHQRRYARNELARKARRAGFKVIDQAYLGWTMFLPFWLVKKRNRRRYDELRGTELKDRVAHDIAQTKDSRLGHLACGAESWLLNHGVRMFFGIRVITVIERQG